MATQQTAGVLPAFALSTEVDFESVTRTPIFDGRDHVFGYELHFWHAAGHGAAHHEPVAPQNAPIDVEVAARGLLAFVPCSPQALSSAALAALPAAFTVIGLPADAALTDAQQEQLNNLKAAGFRLALLGYTPAGSPLFPVADFVQVDANRLDLQARLSLIADLSGGPCRVIAIHVENPTDFRRFRAEGFDLFQGEYVYHPDPLPIHRIPPNRMVHFEILEALQRDPVDLERLSQLIKCDASLTYRLLRLVNSPLLAIRQEITSIKSALLMLGEDTARRFATTAIAAELNTDQPSEILRIALLRGRFCELSATLCGLIATEQYLIGMVSMFPPMLRAPMEEIVKLLPLRESARHVLLGRESAEAQLLRWLMAHESGDGGQVEAIEREAGVSHEELTRRYADAVAWADLVLTSTAA